MLALASLRERGSDGGVGCCKCLQRWAPRSIIHVMLYEDIVIVCPAVRVGVWGDLKAALQA